MIDSRRTFNKIYSETLLSFKNILIYHGKPRIHPNFQSEGGTVALRCLASDAANNKKPRNDE